MANWTEEKDTTNKTKFTPNFTVLVSDLTGELAVLLFQVSEQVPPRALNKLKAAALSGGLGQTAPLRLGEFNASVGLFSASCHMSEGKSTLVFFFLLPIQGTGHRPVAEHGQLILENEAIQHPMAEIGP